MHDLEQRQGQMILHMDGIAQDCSNSIANALELLQSCTKHLHIDGLVQDCRNSIAKALELLQSCKKPFI